MPKVFASATTKLRDTHKQPALPPVQLRLSQPVVTCRVLLSASFSSRIHPCWCEPWPKKHHGGRWLGEWGEWRRRRSWGGENGNRKWQFINEQQEFPLNHQSVSSLKLPPCASILQVFSQGLESAFPLALVMNFNPGSFHQTYHTPLLCLRCDLLLRHPSPTLQTFQMTNSTRNVPGARIAMACSPCNKSNYSRNHQPLGGKPYWGVKTYSLFWLWCLVGNQHKPMSLNIGCRAK